MTGTGVRFGRVACAVLATALAGLGLALTGSVLPAPPVSHPGLWLRWWTASGPVVAVFSVTRTVLLVALGIWAVLFLSAAMVALRRGARRMPAEALGSGWTARRAVVRLALALSTSGAVATACGQPGGRTSLAPPAPVLSAGAGAPLGTGGASPTGPGARESARAPATATPGASQRIGPPPSPASRQPSAPATTTAAVSPSPEAPVPGGTWVVRPGDDLWSIAAAALAARPGADQRAAQEVAPYWLAVIAANRSRLPDPADPSLLYAGDVVILPPV